MAQIQAILFDLDGTIIDTEPAAARALRSFFASHQITITPEDSLVIIGRTWESALTLLHGKYPLPGGVQEAQSKVSKIYREFLEDALPVVPGVVEAIRSLQKDFRLALVSGSLKHEILWALNQLGITDAFECILGGDEYAESKPSPIGYLSALKALGVRAEQSLVFEDSSAGVTSAHRAGCWIVSVTGAHLVPQDVTNAHLSIVDFSRVSSQWIREISQKHLKPK